MLNIIISISYFKLTGEQTGEQTGEVIIFFFDQNPSSKTVINSKFQI